MNITLNIPVQVPNSTFSVAELRKALEEYASSWLAKARVKEAHEESEFQLPSEFEKLCGSISLDKLNPQAATDERISELISE